jgi:hypothetical protein
MLVSCSLPAIVHSCIRQAFLKPYIVSVLPPGSVPTSSRLDLTLPSSASTTAMPSQSQQIIVQTSVVQIRSSLSLLPTQNIPFPFVSAPSATTGNSTVRLLTHLPSAQPSLYAVTTPTDKTLAAQDGSSIWHFCMKSWAEQVDELVAAGSYVDALALLDTIDQAVLPDKVWCLTPFYVSLTV